ncbi:DUF4367 domain-containing protein [Paenibacillus anaericanus]|uniref:DUF4367 domain-containing protein n=1 Tax=Paenibacillus anaericanus TaxID=170367 RepID=A0A433Y8X5_9BACL|nr:DUF4367 domain-containing protein [Paenibacillus anaericanus]RUT46322.1 DUF4367 domain-containing protein [Paenibacillus anaericanus]
MAEKEKRKSVIDAGEFQEIYEAYYRIWRKPNSIWPLIYYCPLIYRKAMPLTGLGCSTTSRESWQKVASMRVFISATDRVKDISLQLRLMNEATAFEADLDDAEEIKINGYEAVVGKGAVSVEINGVMYMFNSRDSEIQDEQLIKMAESL